jgi:phosphoglycerate kinase
MTTVFGISKHLNPLAVQGGGGIGGAGGGGGSKKVFAFDKIPSFTRLSDMQRTAFHGKEIFGRFDLNLKPKGDKLDPKRLDAALPTIKEISDLGGILFVASHRSEPADPKGTVALNSSMRPVAELLRSRLPEKNIIFAGDLIRFNEGDQLTADNFLGHLSILRSNLKSGDIVVLENLRFYPESSKEKPQVEELARIIAREFEIYIDDAFGTAHRGHASIIVPRYKSGNCYVGQLMQLEIDALTPLLVNLKRPFIGVLGGGGKISPEPGKEGKIELLEGLLSQVDQLLLGGQLANVFICAQNNWNSIGAFVPQETDLSAAKQLLLTYPEKIILPVDLLFTKGINIDEVKKGGEIPADKLIWSKLRQQDYPSILIDFLPVDIGNITLIYFKSFAGRARTIFANGPVGVYENPQSAEGTKRMVRFINEAAQQGAYALGGGGDFLAAAKDAGITGKETRGIKLSTGGGALLAAIEKKGAVPAFTAFFRD